MDPYVVASGICIKAVMGPMIPRLPGKVKPGTVSEHISGFQDMLPALLSWHEQIRLLKLLLRQWYRLSWGKVTKNNMNICTGYFTHSQGGKQAIRKGSWKEIRLDINKNPDAPVQLDNELAEEKNLTNQHPVIVEEIK